MLVVESAFLVNLQLVLWFAFNWSVKGKFVCEQNECQWFKVLYW